MLFVLPFMLGGFSFETTMSSFAVVVLYEAVDEPVHFQERAILKTSEEFTLQDAVIGFHVCVFLWCSYMGEFLFQPHHD